MQSLFFLLGAVLFCTSSAASSNLIQVGPYILQSITPAGEGYFDFAYRAVVFNRGRDLPFLHLTLTDRSREAFQVIDGDLSFGPIARQQHVTSSDTFVLRKKGVLPFRMERLRENLKWRPVTNAPPTADAGPDQSVALGATVILDGSRSTDPNGDPLTYRWRIAERPDGSKATLSNRTSVNPSFVADRPGEYAIELIVRDGRANSAPDTVVITTQNTVPNTAPVANAGPNQTVPLGATVTLDASGSTDVDGDPLTYLWAIVTLPSGSTAQLSDPRALQPTFTADKPGVYVVQLIVNDGFTNSPPASVTITTANTAPVANPGANQTVFVGTLVQLDASGSSDVDGDPLAFNWSLTSNPPGSAAQLSDPKIFNPTFVADKPGSYVLQLVVNDGKTDSAAATVTITTKNSPPVADAGPDQSVPLQSTVILDGRNSFDVDLDPLLYEWSLLSQPSGSTASLQNPASDQPSFDADQPGSYVAQLIVDDGQVKSAPDTVVITTLNSRPVADAGPPQTVTVGATVTLDGTGSLDADGDPLSYLWSFTTYPGPAAPALSDPTVAQPTFIGDTIGDTIAQLIVSDGRLSSNPATTLITVTAAPPQNRAPIADAGGNRSVAAGDVVNLDGSASSDPDGDRLRFTWTITNQPAGSQAALRRPASNVPDLVPDLPGDYDTQLIVNDGKVDSAPASVTIAAQATFSLQASPASADVMQGQSVSYALGFNAASNFGQLVALSVGSLPNGVTATFKPAQIAPGATALLTLTVPGTQPLGPFQFTVDAQTSTVGGPQAQASFGLIANVQPVTTSFIGRTVVEDPLETPLAGVTITWLGRDGNGSPTGCNGQTVSDGAGNFAFTNLPPQCWGAQMIRYDGQTVTNQPGQYAGVDLINNILVNQVNVPRGLVHLPRIDDKETVQIRQNWPQDQVFTFATIPNLVVTVYAGTTLTKLNGSQPDPFPLAAIDVPPDRLPDTKPIVPGMIMPFFVAFQPANASASQPVAVVYPNTLNTPPGTVNIPLMTLDPTLGMMVSYGTAQVSADGSQVVPDLDPAHPGHRYGLVHFDWHGPVVQPPNGRDPAPDCESSPGGSAGQSPTPCACYGDPVDLSSGLVNMQETDIAIGGARGGLNFTRYYRSLDLSALPVAFGPAGSSLGAGWAHNYDFHLNRNVFVGASTLTVVTPTGSRIPFVRQPDGTLRNTTVPSMAGAVLANSGNSYVLLRWPDGSTYRFEPGTWRSFTTSAVLTAIKDPNGNQTTIHYNSLWELDQITDPVGRTLTLQYSAGGVSTRSHPIRIIDPMGRIWRYGYNGDTLTSVTDPHGHVHSYEYQDVVFPQTVTAFPLLLRKITDERGVVVADNTFDSRYRVIEQKRADGKILKFRYKSLNNDLYSPILETVTTDPLGVETTYRFSPDQFLLNVTDPLGQTRVFERAGGSNLVTGITGNGVCESCGDPASGDVHFGYDSQGFITSRTDALSNTTQISYKTILDSDGLPAFKRVDTIIDAKNNTTSFEYDTHGNLIERTDANHNKTQLTYGKFGLPDEIIDPLGNKTKLAYDHFANLTSITDPLGNQTTLHYDAPSRPIEVIDALGRKSSTVYDTLDRVVFRTDAKGGITRFDYDQVGNLKQLTDAKKQTTTFGYDIMNQLMIRTTPLGKVDTRTYDDNGNLISFTDRRGQKSLFKYDALDRLTIESYADGSLVTRTYDAQSRLAAVDDSKSGSYSYLYDLAGRTASTAGPSGSVSYLYDPLGRQTERQVTGQAFVSYAYDPVSNLLSAALNSVAVDYSYDARNQVTQASRSNGVITDYTYDALGRVLSIVHANGGTVLDNQQYTYDALGNREAYQTDTGQPLTTRPVVNRHDAGNRLLSSGAKSYGYDDNGNLASETGPAGATNYTWDSRNRLEQIALPNGQTFDFTYDYGGNMIEQRVAGVGPAITRSFVLDEITNVAYQEDSSGSQVSVLTGQDIDSHLATVDVGGQVDFGLTDAINSTTVTADGNGQKSGQYAYEPYGQTTAGGGFPFQYTGRVPVTGDLYYYRARFYDAGVGRFVSEDAIGVLSRQNLFSYVNNRPLNKIDPLGLFDVFVGVDVDIAGPFGGYEYQSGYVIDTDDPFGSGFFGGSGPSFGGSVGVSAGFGFTRRDIEGCSLNFDINKGIFSISVFYDDQGFNGFYFGLGPGGGASSSVTNTKTFSINDLYYLVYKR